MIHFLTTEEVCAIQARTLPSAPSSDIGKVDAIVKGVELTVFYLNLNAEGDMMSTFHMAALYLINIARGHAFPDANKRTAYQSAMVFLELNEILFKKDLDLIDLTVLAATSGIEAKELGRKLFEIHFVGAVMERLSD